MVNYGKAEIFQLVFQPHSARRAFDGKLFASSVGTAQAHLRSRPKMGEMVGQWFLGIFWVDQHGLSDFEIVESDIESI
jgi:hypothetical protein